MGVEMIAKSIDEIQGIVGEVVDTFDPPGGAKENPHICRLLMGTMAAESGNFETRRQHGYEPIELRTATDHQVAGAYGLCQAEPWTVKDMFENWRGLNHTKSEYWEALKSFLPAKNLLFVGQNQTAIAYELQTNDGFSIATCRLHYKRKPSAIPRIGHPESLAVYWKAEYNTAKGKGTIDHFVELYEKFKIGEMLWGDVNLTIDITSPISVDREAPAKRVERVERFELGKRYRHESGKVITVTGFADSSTHGLCLFAEDEMGKLEYIGRHEGATLNWTEVKDSDV